MNTNLNVAMAPKDSTFQVRMNSEIKRAVEDIYARTGMTLTDAFNTFIQQSLNVEGLPFIVTTNSKEALKEQALAMVMLDLKRAEARAKAGLMQMILRKNWGCVIEKNKIYAGRSRQAERIKKGYYTKLWGGQSNRNS